MIVNSTTSALVCGNLDGFADLFQIETSLFFCFSLGFCSLFSNVQAIVIFSAERLVVELPSQPISHRGCNTVHAPLDIL